MPKQPSTDFGYEQVTFAEKTSRVEQVFSSVAHRYDVMNDLMSFGIHRLWKKAAIDHCAAKPNQTILDLAGGTGDLTRQLAKNVEPTGNVILADLNIAMLHNGRMKLIDSGYLHSVRYLQTNAECLPFPNNTFDCISIAFGLRNVAHKDRALTEMYRTIKPGGRVVILEFSHPTSKKLGSLYDAYSFSILPFLGKIIAKDAKSYQYLAESIRTHPNQETLKSMMASANFEKCTFENLSGGICAIHKGFKF